MNPTVKKEIIALILLVAFIATFYLAMPPMVYALGYAAVVLMFVVFVASTVAKTDRDEREESHQAMAAESGFMAGGFILLAAIAHQAFVMHAVDMWLFAALVGMLVVRLGIRLYLDKTR